MDQRQRPRQATASPRHAAPATPANSQADLAPWRLHAEAAALAVDADQLRGEADDLAYRTQAHQARAERLRDHFEQLARRLDPPPPPTGE